MNKQLQQLVTTQKLSHAYLMEGTQRTALKDEALQFAAEILGTDDTARSRVYQHNHSDFYWLETDDQTIKKEMIEEVLHRMNRKPVEGQYKVYVIVDFDKVTVQGENSILKFLEEPPPNTIALLLTTKSGGILPTIHSRCQHITVTAQSNSVIRTALMNGGINDGLAATLAALSFGEEEAMQWMEEKEFSELRTAVLKWADTMMADSRMGLVHIVELLQTVSEREQQLLALDMLQLYFQDVMYIKLNNDQLSFPDHKPKLETVGRDMSLARCVQWIDVILLSKRNLLQYVSPMLVFEYIAIQIAKEVK
ncbi:DNA polymerase III subunit delta' [Macrococcus equipercicus]|uniref:DNA polymerase III subunit delta n=1 Tax=Macrococcus equipercicus TaxID=69967 RepID=A0A9Q9F188_9STAP|nr:DNA polymerase III subunit delta' [Macrococcus equipercicus]UTH13753.1 DNA polymerase III subunit delta' [Macrococcus equipercicus]